MPWTAQTVATVPAAASMTYQTVWGQSITVFYARNAASPAGKRPPPLCYANADASPDVARAA